MCSARKKAKAAAKGEPAPKTRQRRRKASGKREGQDEEKAEKKREAVRLAVQRHRAKQHPDKKAWVREQRMKYYYRKKQERQGTFIDRRQKNYWELRERRLFRWSSLLRAVAAPIQPSNPTCMQFGEWRKVQGKEKKVFPVFLKGSWKQQTDNYVSK